MRVEKENFASLDAIFWQNRTFCFDFLRNFSFIICMYKGK
jgi:hypothetical protein